MRRVALAFLVIGNLLAGQAHAEDVAAQPLTRSDCDKAAMSWDDNANVCVQARGGVKSMPKSEAAEILSQPLTRSECHNAGMTWNDNANVCGKESEAQLAPKATNPAAPSILINIDKASQRMTVLLDGVQRYDWPVSTGKAGAIGNLRSTLHEQGLVQQGKGQRSHAACHLLHEGWSCHPRQL